MSRKQPYTKKLYFVIAGLVVLSGAAAAGAAKAADQRQEAARVRAASSTLQAARPQTSNLPTDGTALPTEPVPAPTATVVPAPNGEWPAVPAAAQLSRGSLGLSGPSSSVSTGERFTVALYAASGDTKVNAVQARLAYDTNRLQLTEIAAGSDFPSQAAADARTPGLIRVARAAPAGVTGTRLVGVFHFTAVSSGAATIGVDNTESLLVAAADASNILQTTRPLTIDVR